MRSSAFFAVVVRDVDGKLFASPMPFGPYDKFNPRMKRYREEGIKFVVSRVTAEAIARKAKRDLLDLGGQTAIAYVQSLMATQVAERQKRIVHTVADGQAD